MSVSCVLSLLATFATTQTIDERPAEPGEWGFRPTDSSVVERNPPSFSWRPQEKASAYDFELARNDNFDSVEYRVEDWKWNVHCPDRVLEPGEWHWRFRVSAGEGASEAWSSTRSFEVTNEALEFPLPRRDELLSRIPKTHPRLFVRPEDLPALIASARGPQAERFAELVAQCEKLLAKPPSTEEPPRYPKGTARKSEEWRAIWWGNRKRTIAVLENAATLAFTWRLGGREEFGKLARRLLLDAATWDPRGATGYRYNDEAGMPYAYHFSRTYTFLHPLLSEEERARCREVMTARGREMYAHLAHRHLWQPYSSHSNRAWHFLGEVGIAFHGEIPEAADWIDFAMQVFANVYPVWSDDDGGWHEGTAYWQSYLSRFTWWADVQKAAFGLDAYELPFFSRAGDFAMYQMPPGTQGGGFGDLNGRRDAQGNRPLMTVLASQARNSYWAWYVEQIGGTDHGRGPIGFLRASAQPVQARSPIDLPSSRLFEGTGIAALNTNLESATDNVEVIFKSSPFGTQSHGYESQNAFLLYAFGERLLIRTGKRDVYGSDHHKNWMWRTKSVNSLTVNGQGQRVHSPHAVGRITDFHTEPGVHTVEGEAAAAYEGRLETFRRRILLLEPDLVLVIDRVRAAEPVPLEWLWHAQVPFARHDAQTFTLENGAASCRLRFLTPEGCTFSQTDQFDPPPRERIKLTEHHLTAARLPGEQALFVTAIRVHRAGEEPAGLEELTREERGVVVSAPLAGGQVEIVIDLEGGLRVSGSVGDRQLEYASEE